jgi:uncharacterized 2Fe-2S/4Fe-4S cluster protein (DUF4445 family)
VLPWLAAFDGGDVAAGLLSVLPEGLERFLLLDLGTNGELALYDRGRLTVTAAAAGPAFEGSSRGGGASAVLDDLAKLRREGALDKSGLLAANAPDWFTQKEIRDLQLAKSAVRAGLEILLDTAGLRYEELDAVYLAGGIGQAMNPESARAVGLLPPGGQVRAVGNASLGGAVRLLLAPRSANEDLQRIRSSCTELNLAAHPRFQMFFVEHLEL